MHADIIERIYEAAGQPSRWPAVLDDIAKAVGAAGGLVVIAHTDGSTGFVSEALMPLFLVGQKAGHFENNERSAPMIANMSPGFVTDTDLYSYEQMSSMSVYRDFLIPEKMDAGAATVFQGAADDVMILSFEGFASHDAARAMLTGLDILRPHLGRALSLSAQAQLARDRAVVESLEAMGSGAAIVGGSGRLRAYNARFEARLGGVATDGRSRLRFASRRTDAMFVAAIAKLKDDDAGCSLVLRPSEERPPCVMHVVPLRRKARDVFGSDGALLLLADGANNLLPNGDVLRLLFDLTPTEAKLARALLEEEDLRLAATAVGMTYQSARVYLKRIFQKTATNRQASLIRLLGSYGRPGAIES